MRHQLLTLLGALMTAIFCCSSLSATEISTAPNQEKPNCYYVKHYDKTLKKTSFIQRCEPPKTFRQKIDKLLGSLTSQQHSALQEKLERQKASQAGGYTISYYAPTYMLPFYYTGSPANSVYAGRALTNNQAIMKEEFKAQFSFQFPIWPHINGSTFSLGMYYTQLMYWQVYAKSQYFRETNYEPALFISDHFLPNWLLSAGVVHQSNGRGGVMERSWNRAYGEIEFSGRHWTVSIKPWLLIFAKESSDLHNPKIARYLGYGRVVMAYKINKQEISLMVRNALTSGFKRGGYELGYSFPITAHLNGFIQLFTGYGQSMLEYRHRTTSGGIGFSLSNWM
jgi:phospholipase A1/A2